MSFLVPPYIIWSKWLFHFTPTLDLIQGVEAIGAVSLVKSSPEVAHTTQAASGPIQQLHLCLERKGKGDQKESDWSETIFLKDCGEKWRRISQGGTGTLRAQCLSSSIPRGSREDFDPDCSLLSPFGASAELGFSYGKSIFRVREWRKRKRGS